MNFYQAWSYLNQVVKDYPYDFSDYLSINVVRVNPLTQAIDENHELNSHTRVWLEFGFDSKTGEPCHDPIFDIGNDTFEGAICVLAIMVKATRA